MDDSPSLAVLLAVWMVAAGVAVLAQRRIEAAGAGLVIAYLANLWLLHWPAAAIYLLPDYSNYDPDVVEAGFWLSVYAVVGFALGSAAIAPYVAKLTRFGRRGGQRVPDSRLAAVYVVIGLVAYLVLLPVLRRVPTLTALVSAMWNLLVVGLGLGCWHAWRQRRRRALLVWAAGAASLPLLTIVSEGFLGYGTGALLIVIALLASFARWRPRVIALGALVAYLGLSFYVTYMRDRDEIRIVVWGGEALDARIGQLYRTLSTLEWFDPGETKHLRRIDERLNQNVLVGAAVSYLESGSSGFASGETLWQALAALVPRVLWPDKPVVAGSMGYVSAYTGIEFQEGTSVGLGQVLEFYINFGPASVVVGFMVLGTIIALVDMAAARRLVSGNWQGFTLWYLPGISLLQAGGSLVELTSGAGASVVAALVVGHLLRPLGGARAPSPPRASRAPLARPGEPVG